MRHAPVLYLVLRLQGGRCDSAVSLTAPSLPPSTSSFHAATASPLDHASQPAWNVTSLTGSTLSTQDAADPRVQMILPGDASNNSVSLYIFHSILCHLSLNPYELR